MRSIWKGSIAFGLVNVPVKVYSATGDHDIKFHQVHAKDNGRIRYKRVCEVCGEVVEYSDLARAYESDDGRMVVITDDDIAQINGIPVLGHQGPGSITEALARILAGFPVVDIAVKLVDGSYHTVDSSDMAFRQAGRLAMSEGMPKCAPVLLEPVMSVEIAVPSEATARINGIIPQRRGQILGFDAREGWPGWDVVKAQIPESEMDDLIVELRSATSGVGTYTAKFDHLAELTGRLADQVLAAHKPAA